MAKIPTYEEARKRVMNQGAVSAADLAALLGVHISTIHKQGERGALPVPASRVGQRWVFAAEPIRKWLANGEETKGLKSGAA